MTRAKTRIALLVEARHHWLNRHGRRWLGKRVPSLEQWVAKSTAHGQADRYRKHVRSRGHFRLLLDDALGDPVSLRQSDALLVSRPDWLARSGRMSAEGKIHVSHSQFADANTTRPAGFMGEWVRAVRQRSGEQTAALGPLWSILDSTFLGMSLK